MVRGFNKFLYYSNFNLQGRSTAMVVWRGSTVIVTTASVSMDLERMERVGRDAKDIDEFHKCFLCGTKPFNT